MLYIIFLFLIVLIIGLHTVHKEYKKYLLLTKSDEYLKLFHLYYDTSYDICYKDHIVTYSSEGLNVDPDTLETIKRNYIKIILELMGPSIKKLLIDYFGNMETAMENMITYMETKLDNDIILDSFRNKHNDQEK